jgi:hypothetical protein
LISDAELSAGLSRVGSEIRSLWEGLTSAGFDYPARMRTHVKEFALTDDEANFLDQYWVEIARERLARSPFHVKQDFFDRTAVPGQAYRSEFLDGTLARMQACELQVKSGLVEPPVLRFHHGKGPNGLRSEHRAIWQASLPEKYWSSHTHWIDLSSAERYSAVSDRLLAAMSEHEMYAIPARAFDRLPIFRCTRIGKSLELVAFLQAEGKQLRLGMLDLRLAIIPLDQESPFPFRAFISPNQLVPFFQGYQALKNIDELEWNCSAIATLVDLFQQQVMAAFSSTAG